MDTDVNLAEVLVQLADTLVDDFDVVDFMQLLIDKTVALVGVDAAGLMLANNGHGLGLVAWTGRSIVNASLADAELAWPSFGAELATSGFGLVHAFPMRLRGQVIGSLNAFSAAGELSGHDARERRR